MPRADLDSPCSCSQFPAEDSFLGDCESTRTGSCSFTKRFRYRCVICGHSPLQLAASFWL